MPTPRVEIRETPEQRSARARRAALAKNAACPDSMEAARAKKRALFEAAVDPDGKLDPAEREKRADRLWRAWHTDLSYQASRKRRGQTYRKLVLSEWLAAFHSAQAKRAAMEREYEETKKAAAPLHDGATAPEEERDADAPASKEERRVADVPARS